MRHPGRSCSWMDRDRSAKDKPKDGGARPSSCVALGGRTRLPRLAAGHNLAMAGPESPAELASGQTSSAARMHVELPMA